MKFHAAEINGGKWKWATSNTIFQSQDSAIQWFSIKTTSSFMEEPETTFTNWKSMLLSETSESMTFFSKNGPLQNKSQESSISSHRRDIITRQMCLGEWCWFMEGSSQKGMRCFLVLGSMMCERGSGLELASQGIRKCLVQIDICTLSLLLFQHAFLRTFWSQSKCGSSSKSLKWLKRKKKFQ